jgi:hypothetical protein
MELHKASDEQQCIINNLREHNVVVDSVAGSGKTTTVLHIAKTFKNKNVLLLTYNSKLRIETNEKKKLLCLNNLEVHTFHSYCVKYYKHDCFTDYQILYVLKFNIPNKVQKKAKYDILIFDETQDMTPTYYELCLKIFADNENDDAHIAVLGDKFQSIYGFNNADPRFITFAHKLFNVNKYEWKHTKLSTSYRISQNMSIFINKCILNEDRMKALKVDNKQVSYIICNTYDDLVFKMIVKLLTVYKSHEIFILAPSLRSEKTPARTLANKLTKNDVDIYVPNSDEEKLDFDIIKNKLVFSTFHQAKGLERKVCLVLCFDNSYFKYYKKDSNPMVCPNEIYVAVTRASEKLILVHHNAYDYLPFIDLNNLNMYAQVQIVDKLKKEKNNVKKSLQDISVTNLLRHLSTDIILECVEHFQSIEVREIEENIDISIKTKQSDDTYESVSEITGTALPAYFELVNTGKMTIYEHILKENVFETIYKSKKKNTCMFDDEDDKTENDEKTMFNKIDLENIQPNELLFLANLYCSYLSGYKFKLKQISNYDWLTHEQLVKSYARLNNVVSKNAEYEIKFSHCNDEELFGIQINGMIDCIDGNKIYEFKCVSELKKEYAIQLALYAYIVEMNNHENIDYEYYLYNILTNEMMQIVFDIGQLKKMVQYIIFNKFISNTLVSDADFVKKSSEIKSKFF